MFCSDIIMGTYVNWERNDMKIINLIQNSPACAVVRAPKSSHVTPSLLSLHMLKTKERVNYRILTYKVLTTTKPSYVCDLISLQLHRSTRSSDVVTLARPTLHSSLKVNYCSFCHASPCLWNELAEELRHHHFHYASLHFCSTPDH